MAEDALSRAHGAKPEQLATLRGDLEWETTQKDARADVWLALGIVYLRLGDRASAETTLRHAEARAGEKDLGTAIEITAALDATRGEPIAFQGKGVIRTGPKRRIFVELPGATFRWAGLRVGELLAAGVTPKVGDEIEVKARLGRRGWEVFGIKPTGTPPKGTLGKDGTYVRCGELRFLPLAEPCPPELLKWEAEAWREAASALPIRASNDRKTYVDFRALGVEGWAGLAEKLGGAPPPAVVAEGAAAPVAPLEPGVGKLSTKGKHLVVGPAALELVESDVCEPAARRGRYASWRAVVDAVPYTQVERKVSVDWPALSARHALEPAVASWLALAVVLDARPPPSKPPRGPAPAVEAPESVAASAEAEAAAAAEVVAGVAAVAAPPPELAAADPSDVGAEPSAPADAGE